MNILRMSVILGTSLFTLLVHGQTFLSADVNAVLTGTTSLDANTGLYTYKYSVTNYGDSKKLANTFYIPLKGANIINLTVPRGWSGSIFRDESMVSFCACEEEGFELPSGFVDYGQGVPSKFAVAPGTTLTGFSFQSAYPPSPSIYYVGGWVPIPIEGIDFPEGQEPVIPPFPKNKKIGNVAGPSKNDAIATGGRRPAVDGFLVFANFKDGGLYSRPVVVDIIFSQNGENVIQSTFKATLNGADVTPNFKSFEPNRRRAVFDTTAGSSLIVGKNILQTSVQGTVGSSSRKATDVDKATFLVQ